MRKKIVVAAILAYIAIIVGVAATKAFGANQAITLQPGDTLTVTAAQGGSGPPPPGTITCSDGSVHTLPYTCPVTPPPVVGACVGFAKTLWMKANWAAPTRMLTASYGGFGVNDIVVYEFTTGNGPSQTN